MIPLRSDVTAAVLALLGDTQASGGSIYTSAFQAPYLNLAYQELFSKLQLLGAERIQREGYFLLPAYTGVLYPSVAGLSNFGGPVEIRERGTATAYAISAATPNAAAGTCALTVAALPASVITGAQGEVYGVAGVSDDVNDQWTLTVNSTTSVVLNGCAATGTYTSGGSLIYSTEQWSGAALDPRSSTTDFPTTAGASLGMYCWQRGILRFPTATAARELKLTYHLSASLPVVASPVAGDSMGVDDGLNVLAARTAQYCAGAKGNPRKMEMQQLADYHLNLLLGNATRQMSAGETIVAGRFRGKRNIHGMAGW